MSTNARRPSDTPDRFLFVNKDASTIRVREKDLKLDTAIQSHVQRHMHRKSFAESQIISPILNEEVIDSGDALDEAVSAIPSFAQHGPARLFDSSISPPEHAERPQFGRQTRGSDQHDYFRIASHRTETPFDSSADPDTIVANSLTQSSPSQATTDAQTSGRTRLLEKAAPALLRYWRTVIVPERFFLDARCTSLSQFRHAQALDAHYRGIFVRHARLCALLASIAVHMLVHEKAILVPALGFHERAHLPLALKTLAIEAIRNELSRGDFTRELLYDVQSLWIASDVKDSTRDMELHRKALSDLIEKFGGLENMDEYFLETHLKLQWYKAISILEGPPPDVTRVCYARSAVELNPVPTPTTLPQLIADGIERQELCPVLLDQARELFEISDHARQMETGCTYNTKTAQRLYFGYLTIGYRLLHLKYEQPDLEALRIALVYYTAMLQSERFDTSCASRTVEQLRSVLEPILSSGDEIWQHQQDWLLWVVFIGCLTARNTISEAWFADIGKKLIRDLDLRSFRSLERRLSGVLYDQALLQKNLWDFHQIHMAG